MKLPENLSEILETDALLKKFKVFLRGHLALENLLFYESIDLYETLEEESQMQRGGKFMVNQFVRSDSEDATNLSYQTREQLESLELYEHDSFNRAKNEMFRLMDSNFFAEFGKYLEGDGQPLIEEFSPFLSKSYFKDVSYNSLAELLDNNDGKLDFLNCACQRKDSNHSYCCEKGRAKYKLQRILKKYRDCPVRRMKRKLHSMRRSSMTMIMKLGFGSSKSKSTSKAKKYVYSQVSDAKNYPCFKGCKLFSKSVGNK